VAVRRTPPESDDKELADFYAQVIRTGRDVRRGDWRLSEVRPVGGDATARNILAWSWEADDRVHLVAVNLSGSAAQSWVDMPPGALRTPVVRLADLFSGLVVEHEADDLAHQGLYVSLDGHGFHVLHTT
jgi:hypothetical protein